MPHGACYFWNRNLVFLHVASDGAIALAYCCLPMLLWYFIHKRHDIPFSWLFAMFGAFILSCGTTHLLSIWTLWHADYLVEGMVKLVTALISLTTAVAMILYMPQALALPTPSQMREKEQQLELALEKEREINEFRRRIVSTVSHEYRTPLTAILSSVELLERYIGSNSQTERTARHFGVIKRKVNYLTQLIEHALILDKAESGKLEFQPIEMDAIAHTQEILAELDWNSHLLKLSAEGIAVGQFDPKLLNALVTNLIYNASKYSEPETTVFVRLFVEGNAFVLEIQDQGIGIPQDDLPKIFESYYRGTNVDERPGTGVGLAIVRKCVTLHGGKVTVNSEIGVGTTFRVALPLANIAISHQPSALKN